MEILSTALLRKLLLIYMTGSVWKLCLYFAPNHQINRLLKAFKSLQAMKKEKKKEREREREREEQEKEDERVEKKKTFLLIFILSTLEE